MKRENPKPVNGSKPIDRVQKLTDKALEASNNLLDTMEKIMSKPKPSKEMKIILYALLFLLPGFAVSQTDTLTPQPGSTYKWQAALNHTWILSITDTVTILDSLFVGSDTITNGPDSVVIFLPNTFAEGFAGMMTFDTDSIIDTLQGDVSIDLYQAATADAPYVFITGTDADHTSPPDTSHKFFQLRGTKLKILYWAVNGTSRVRLFIVLKPSSIANNAAN